jgi:hypothetical protein
MGIVWEGGALWAEGYAAKGGVEIGWLQKGQTWASAGIASAHIGHFLVGVTILIILLYH